VAIVDRLKTALKEGVDYHPYLPREDGRLPMSDFGGTHRFHVSGLYHDMWGFPSEKPSVIHGLIRHLVDKIENNVDTIARYKTFYLDDARTILISYGATARSALHVVELQRRKGQKYGLLELQTLWPFPYDLVRETCAEAKYIIVVEMNLGQICREVKQAVTDPERVFLANRVDGVFITPTDIRQTLRLIQGKGV
jgi:2-oxoglutarate ferredoxin oxidoreductase subunit alpha